MVFKRRKPEEGKITSDMKTAQIYDYIRMLDAEGYPTFPHPRSLTGMDVLSRTRGMAAGMERAEAFMLIRKTIKRVV